jgi:hypothetical protein
MEKHSSGTAFRSTVPSSLLGASLLEEGNERHDLNALWSGRRIERILELHVGLVIRNLLESDGAVRDGRRENGVIDRLAFGGRRQFFGLGGRSRKVDSLKYVQMSAILVLLEANPLLINNAHIFK